MTRWKMVPVKPTDAMWQYTMDREGYGGSYDDVYDAMLAAAPAWEPSDEDVERALDAYVDSPALDIRTNMRAALKAAIGGHDEH